jgi:hypothetical protein
MYGLATELAARELTRRNRAKKLPLKIIAATGISS